MTGPVLRRNLTARDGGVVVTANGRPVGCTIGLANGLWAAWSRTSKIGEYATQDEATVAVHRAARQQVKRTRLGPGGDSPGP